MKSVTASKQKEKVTTDYTNYTNAHELPKFIRVNSRNLCNLWLPTLSKLLYWISLLTLSQICSSAKPLLR
jgi:hypothetical protein